MVKEKMIAFISRTGLQLKKHSPEILMGIGIVSIVGGTVMACRATLKVDEVLEKHHENLEKIHSTKDLIDRGALARDQYNEEDYKKDLTIQHVHTVVNFIKLYAPGVTLVGAGIACVLGSHGIMRKRNLALVAAYKLVETSFSDYRQRVRDEFGDAVDQKLRFGGKEVVIEETITDENGKEKKVKTKALAVDPNGYSQYAKIFDETCAEWNKSSEYNLMFIKCQQNTANDMLRMRGHLFLNEVYDMLGFERTQAGQMVGWVKGEGDDFVDFGVFDINQPNARRFVNGLEKSIILDFNVAGIIYDLI